MNRKKIVFLSFMLFSSCIVSQSRDFLQKELNQLSIELNKLSKSLNKLSSNAPQPPKKTYTQSNEVDTLYNLAQNYHDTPKQYNNQFTTQPIKNDILGIFNNGNLKNFDPKKITFIIKNMPAWFAEETAFSLIKTNPQKFSSILDVYTNHEISSLTLSPDQTIIACTTYKNKKTQQGHTFLFDLTTRKITHTWNFQKDMRSCAFHPVGRSLLAIGGFGKGENSQNIYIFDYKNLSNQPITTINAHTDDVTAVTFSQDGSLLASIADDGIVKVWDSKTWQESMSFKGHKSYGHSVSFNADQTMLASSAMDGTVKVWDLKNKKLIHTFVDGTERTPFGPDDHSSCTLFHPTITNVLVVSLTSRNKNKKGSVELYDINHLQKVISYPYDFEGAISLGFSPDSKNLIARGPLGHIVTWDYASTTKISEIGILSSSFCSAIFSPTNEIITGYDPKLADLIFWKDKNITNGNDLLETLYKLLTR